MSSIRKEDLLQVAKQKFDLIVVGGGVTGAGIALDAASRGIRTLLLEKSDFASGTSSKSTKLIHGGLRYLKQFEFKLVRDTGRERALIHKLAPHLVIPEKMLLPLVKGGTFGKTAASFGLWMYDLLAGVKGYDRRKMLGKKGALKAEPLLNHQNLTGGGLYAEYRTDDARLTIELIKAAKRHGAKCFNYLSVSDFNYEDGIISGVNAKDDLSDEVFSFGADFVVSAAGPWVDLLRKKNKSLNSRSLHLTKGVHVVMDHQKMPLKQSVYFDVPDGRMIFAIPRGRATYIGTTDTHYKGSLDQVHATREDIDYLLKSVNATFPETSIHLEDIESTWAGLRPLIKEDGKSPSDISRKDEIFEAPNGLISIAGGKLTGYRKMAKKVVDLVAKKHPNSSEFEACRTASIPLHEDSFADFGEIEPFTKKLAHVLEGLPNPQAEAKYLIGNYGRSALGIAKSFKEKTAQALLLAELEFCVKNEMVRRSSDFLVRRTGRLFFNIQSVLEHKALVSKHLAKLFQWIEPERKADLRELDDFIDQTLHFRKEPALDMAG